MPKAHAETPTGADKSPAQQQDEGTKKGKAGLKGMTFAEGEKARAPVQGKGGKSLGARIGGALGFGKSKGDKNAKDDTSAAPADDQDDQDEKPTPKESEAAPTGADREKAYASAKVKDEAIRKWCVPGLDDEWTVTNCVVTRKASPDEAANLLHHATGQINLLKFNRVYQQRYAHMSDDEMIGVALYTTNAAFPVNAILRGLLKSGAWVSAYAPMIAKITAGLKAAPKGSRNQQELTNLIMNPHDDKTNLLDDTKETDEVLPIKECYRQDGWNATFDKRFAADFKVGRALEEPGFYSATLKKGNFVGGSINTTIVNPKIARSVADMSTAREAEVVMPPGQRFQIVGIEKHDTQTGQVESVSDPTAKLPKDDQGKRAFNQPGLSWEIKVKHVGVAKDLKKNAESYDDNKKKGKSLRSRLGMG